MRFFIYGTRSREPFLAAVGMSLLLSLSACTDTEFPQGRPTAQPPQAATLAAGDILGDQATLHGSVDPYGTTVETWFQFGSVADFDWGPFSDSLAYETARSKVWGDSAQAISATIGSLWPGTTYYFRVVARNDFGIGYGAVLSFVPATAPPVLLPNGAGLAFVRDGNIYAYSVAESGTELTQLTTAGTFDHPTWSPDAQRIAFASLETDGGDYYHNIYVINADGSGLRLFAEGTSPAWSPDGRRLAFSASDNWSTAILVKSVDDADEATVRVGFEMGYHDFPAWSPDGSRIAFVSDWDDFDYGNDVYIANADGSGITRVTGRFTVGSAGTHTTYLQPSWSPDGRSLAVVACQHWSSSGCTFSTVMVMAVDGSGFKTLANTTGFARPTWTADGSALLFSRWCADGACQSGLYQVAAAGGGDRLVMADAHSGVWRP